MTDAATVSETKPPLEGEVLAPETKTPILRNPNGKFAKGNPWAWSAENPGPGRTPGLRNRIQANFLQALADDFDRYGETAIRQMRRKKPADYVKVIASLLPKQVEISDKPFDDISDDEIAAILLATREALHSARSSGKGAEAAVGHEQAAGLPPVPEAAGLPPGGE